jgi:hypothetical protein
MEAFLSLCDDLESDVRMVADECINRSIKVRCFCFLTDMPGKYYL